MEEMNRLIQGLTILRKYIGDIPCPVNGMHDNVLVYLDTYCRSINKEDYRTLKNLGWWPQDPNYGDVWMWG